MGAARHARPVNLICGLISNDPDLMTRAVRLLAEHAGPTDDLSDTWPFDWTDYYAPEMGEGLLRRFASFERLIGPEEIVHLKLLTNDLEHRITRDCALPDDRRLVNLDPGYVALSKLLLATTKDGSHRVYLRDGVYAESTLHYRHGRWESWPWTYRDYADPRYHAFFERVRECYRAKLDARTELDPSRGDAR